MAPDWKDYIALFIAALETLALPFILLILALIIVYMVFFVWL
ncbi:MAG: hypothetical protein SVE93_03400 [Candidatus Thermoplasmatota archaeon]|nr:hypothetical protein [Candidatus Thermoplasmatota archaeon]